MEDVKTKINVPEQKHYSRYRFSNDDTAEIKSFYFCYFQLRSFVYNNKLYNFTIPLSYIPFSIILKRCLNCLFFAIFTKAVFSIGLLQLQRSCWIIVFFPNKQIKTRFFTSSIVCFGVISFIFLFSIVIYYWVLFI